MSKQRDYQIRLREQGKCARCRKPCEINERTGKPYEHCPNCRAAYNSERLARYHEKKSKRK